MHAIILAAGRGSQSAQHSSGGLPACLLEFGGRSLLARQLDLLYRLGIRYADLVVGYEASAIIDHVGTLASRPDVAYHFNPRYEKGSVLSLLAAGETLASGSDVLLMEANQLCHPAILQRLVESTVENCFLLDRGAEAGIRIAMHEKRMVDFRAQLPAELDCDSTGGSVGFYRFGAKAGQCIQEECARFESEGLDDAPYEEALRNVLLSCPLAFGYEEITGLPWVAVDRAEDLARASREILPVQ